MSSKDPAEADITRIPVLQPTEEVPVADEATPPMVQELATLRRLPLERRKALSAEAHYLLDELLDECLPFLEARLRERLEQRVRELLAD